MYLKRFTITVTVRIALLLATMTLFAAIAGRADLFFSQIILGILIIWQIFGLVTCVQKTNRDLAKFLLSVESNDLTVHFEHHHDPTFEPLHNAFKDIVSTYRRVGTEREVQYQYLQLLVSRIDVGIISLRGADDIALMNQAALDLLQTDEYRHWHNLRRKHPQLVQAADDLRDGESKLLELTLNNDTKRLSIQAQTAILLGESYRIITLQDIEQEINQSEVAAYHRLIRILTHEIMNSITPITSLSETLLMLLNDEEGRLKPWKAVGERYLPDLAYSLETIKKRGDGLLHFVEDYRKLTKVPQPRLASVPVVDLLLTVGRLMQAELQPLGVKLTTEVQPEEATLWCDPGLVEQVLINLITNSMHALATTSDPRIKLVCYHRQDQIIIEVSDNGTGIDADKLDQIFVPFFSTKEHGSGVGLSLSRHIMTLHRGAIRVQSPPGQHTSFFLHFRTVSG